MASNRLLTWRSSSPCTTSMTSMSSVFIIIMSILLCYNNGVSAYHPSRSWSGKTGKAALEAANEAADAVIEKYQTPTGNTNGVQSPDVPKNVSFFFPTECPTSNRSVTITYYRPQTLT
jgi:hypothetical protein